MSFPRLEEFLLERHDLTQGRKQYYRAVFKSVAKFTEEPFSLNRQNMNLVLEQLHGVYRTKQSWKSAVAAIRVVYRWLNGGEYPDSVAHVKYPTIRPEDTIKNKILSEQEVRALIQAADNPRDKAMVGVGWEGGFRLGELLGLTVGDCAKVSYGTQGQGYDVTVTGKTGTRSLPIVVVAPLLDMWLHCHPSKNDKQAPLWTRMKGDRYVGISSAAAHRMIKLLARRAGMKKNVHFYMLRHSQATFYARNEVNEQKMRGVFGWTMNSNMPSIYTHLTGRDYKDTALRLRGVTKVERKIAKPLMEPRKCFRCGELNVFDAEHCQKCGMVLDPEEAVKIVQKQKEMEEALGLLKDSEIVANLQLLEKLRKSGLLKKLEETL